MIINYIILLAIFCLTPAGVIWLCRKYPALDALGPIMILYALGILLGNLQIMKEEIVVLQDLLPNVAIPLAIPMMLYGCKFTKSDTTLQLKVVVSGFLSVAIAIVIGFLCFGNKVAEGAEIGGIMSGMYTGGMLNAAALQSIFQVSSEGYIMLCSYDIIISFLYLVFLVGVGIRFARRLFRQKTETTLTAEEKAELDAQIAQTKQNPYKGLFTKEGLPHLKRGLLLTLAIAAISAGVALPFGDGWFMVVFILMISTLAVVASFKQKVRDIKYSYDVGMYFIYIFSITIASMADFSSFDLMGGLNQLAYIVVAVFGSLVLHALFCRLMKVDADSMVVSSVAFINSPPFVPMISAAMKNKQSLIVGLGAGIIGYAGGNYFGVLMAQLLGIL